LGGGLGDFVAAGGHRLPGALLVVAIAAGCVLLWRRVAVARSAVVFAALSLALVCVSLTPSDRWLLPVLPFALLALAALPHAARARGLRAALCLPAGAVLAFAAASLPWHLRTFVASHPLAEVAAARALRAQLTDGDPIVSTYPSMPRHVHGRVLWLDPGVLE